jgi:hypothetical protein
METAAVTAIGVGDRLMIDGRVRLVTGFTPMSVEPARIYFLDQTGESTSAELELVVERAGEAA